MSSPNFFTSLFHLNLSIWPEYPTKVIPSFISGIVSVPPHETSSHRPGLPPPASADFEARTAQVPPAPGGGGGHPPQDHPDIPQSELFLALNCLLYFSSNGQ